MTITSIHSKKAFLPEVEAYSEFFRTVGIECRTALPEDVETIKTDVEWHFMGLDRIKTKGRIKVHEYASSSVGSWPSVRNLSKKLLNVTPDFRMFLNPYVKERFGFSNKIPHGFRDMGIDAKWLNLRRGTEFKYDFVYIGDLSPARQPEGLLDIFTKGSLKNKTLLLISNNYTHLQNLYSDFSNIIFSGPVSHSLIPSLLLQAQYAINYIIDNAPYNRQTSTKLLEYAACGIPIISTRYKWIEDFQSEYGGRYYYLKPDMSFNYEDIESFNFSQPDLSEWTWEKQIRGSGILEFLSKI